MASCWSLTHPACTRSWLTPNEPTTCAPAFSKTPITLPPSVIDVEVLSVIRRDHLLGRLDSTSAAQAVEDLRDWPGERFGHRPLLGRVWELRSSLRTWDAFYVALAEVLQATFVTSDSRLAGAPGPRCTIDVV